MNRGTRYSLAATATATGVALIVVIWSGLHGVPDRWTGVVGAAVGLLGFVLFAVTALGRRSSAQTECAGGGTDHLAGALATLDVAVVTTGADGQVLHVNPAAEALLGWQAAEAVGLPLSEVLVPVDEAAEALAATLEQSRRELGHVPLGKGALPLRTRSGDVCEVAGQVTAMRLADGTLAGFTITCSGGTGPATEPRESTSLRAMVECVPIGVSLFSPDGKAIFANRQAREMFGLAGDEAAAVLLDSLPHPDDVARCRAEFRKVAAGEVPRAEFRMRCSHGGSGERVVGNVCLPIELPGATERVLLLTSDVTEKERGSNERRWEWEQRRLILDHTQEQLMYLGTNLEVGWANRAADPDGRTALGALTCHKLLFGVDEPCEGCPALTAMREGRLAENAISLAGRHRMVSARPVYSDLGELKGVVVSARDTSRMHEVERQLFQAQKLDALGRLAGGIAHDFNNMLNVVIGYVDLLGLEQREELRADYVSSIMQAARAAEGLVRQLLAFSRSAGEVKRSEVDVCTLTRAFTKLVGGVLGASIEVTVDVPDEPLLAEADAGQLEQAMMNLCINARDAMPTGGTLSIRTFPVVRDGSVEDGAYGVACRGRLVCCEIRDSGTGIPKQIVDRIFDPFFTTKVSGEGTGLGLSTTHAIVANHGGFLEVESELGKGSAFRILLPQVGEVARKSEPAAAPVLADEFRARDGETIFMVEDDERLRTIVHGFLQRAGYRVFVASDGPSAMELFDQHCSEVSLALLDVVLPGCSGIVVAHHIIEQRPGLPVLFCSGYPHDTVGIEEFEEKLISKPFRRLQLMRRLREELDQHMVVG